MLQILTRPLPNRKHPSPTYTPYEVAVFDTEFDWDQQTATVVAKFRNQGDAVLYAQALRDRTNFLHYAIVVRN